VPPATTGWGAGGACRGVRVQNVVIHLGAVAFVGIGVVVGYWWVVSWLANAHGVSSGRACVGLDLAVDRRHIHGWVTAFDAATASWIGNSVHRSHGLDEASLITEWLGSPVEVAVAGLVGGALLAWRTRSLRTGIVVIGTVAGAVFAETAIKAVIYRPLTQAEIQALPLLSTGHHSFPSGHVAGIGALLGIIAVSIAIGRSRFVQALLTVLVGAGVVIVAFSRLYLGHHWLSDVIGGALVAGVAVILGTVALTTRCDQSVRARSAPCPA
jgi:membrane-associated phospholipid phosphatase